MEDLDKNGENITFVAGWIRLGILIKVVNTIHVYQTPQVIFKKSKSLFQKDDLIYIWSENS